MAYQTPEETAAQLRTEIAYFQEHNLSWLSDYPGHFSQPTTQCVGCALGKIYLAQHPDERSASGDRIYQDLRQIIPPRALGIIDSHHRAGRSIAVIAEWLATVEDWETFYEDYDSNYDWDEDDDDDGWDYDDEEDEDEDEEEED